eukprot:5586143-Amphidinium_carterae.1
MPGLVTILCHAACLGAWASFWAPCIGMWPFVSKFKVVAKAAIRRTGAKAASYSGDEAAMYCDLVSRSD